MTTFKEKTTAVKEKLDPRTGVDKLWQDFMKDFSSMSTGERIKRIGQIIFAATIGKMFGLKQRIKEKEEEIKRNGPAKEKTEEKETKTEKKEREDASPKTMDPCLEGDAAKGEAICRKGIKINEVAKDHQHNAKMMEVAPAKLNELKKIVSFYKANKERYDKVAKATGIPGMLICSIHYREGMKFDRYLHNGQKLGSPTTYVPAGILFKEAQWEEAAIHALGGNIKDANGKPSLKDFRHLKDELGLSATSKDIGAMMAFSERYNGMGYRSRGVRSCYVYGGTNLLQKGRFVADRKFDAESTDRRLGTAAIIMGIQAEEAQEPLRIAGRSAESLNIAA